LPNLAPRIVNTPAFQIDILQFEVARFTEA
jgi:hypothetical protein